MRRRVGSGLDFIMQKQYIVIGLLLGAFGFALDLHPQFAYQGDLYRINPLFVSLYADWFLFAGAVMVARRPATLQGAFLRLTPILFHLSANIARVIVRWDVDLFAVVVLYAINALMITYWILSNYAMVGVNE